MAALPATGIEKRAGTGGGAIAFGQAPGTRREAGGRAGHRPRAGTEGRPPGSDRAGGGRPGHAPL